MKTEKITIKTYLFDKYMEQNNLSKTAFCKKCKITLPTLNKIYSGKENFRITALFKISKIIKIQVFEMFN